MKERDRELVDTAEAETKRLKKELTEVKEAAKQFSGSSLVQCLVLKSYITAAAGLDGTEDELLTVGDFLRLAKALEEVKHG